MSSVRWHRVSILNHCKKRAIYLPLFNKGVPPMNVTEVNIWRTFHRRWRPQFCLKWVTSGLCRANTTPKPAKMLGGGKNSFPQDSHHRIFYISCANTSTKAFISCGLGNSSPDWHLWEVWLGWEKFRSGLEVGSWRIFTKKVTWYDFLDQYCILTGFSSSPHILKNQRKTTLFIVKPR